MNYYDYFASQIRKKGKVKEWRHTSGGMMQHRAVDTVYIPSKAIRAGHNTWVFFTDESEDSIELQFHRTVILRFHRDGSTELRSSYCSITTMARHKQFASGLRLFSDHGDLYASYGGFVVPAIPGIRSGFVPTDRERRLHEACRIGDKLASTTLATLLRTRNEAAMADAVESETGRRYCWRGMYNDTKARINAPYGFNSETGFDAGLVWIDATTHETVRLAIALDGDIAGTDIAVGTRAMIDGRMCEAASAADYL